jgi:lipoate-protein ligase B
VNWADDSAAPPDVLQVYLLGVVEFDAVLRLQRRLHYDVSGDPSQAALVVCEHPSQVTMGRHASRNHLKVDPEEHGWPTRWVARGGGAWLHQPGQLALYPIFPLTPLRLAIPAYLHALTGTMARVFDDFSVRQRLWTNDCGVWIGDRLAAAVGISVRHLVTSFGAILNICPDLDGFRGIQAHPTATAPMTSLERERHGPVRMSHVRELMLEHFQAIFGFRRCSLFTDHPLLHPPTGEWVNNVPRLQTVAKPM